jgi:hypothetical protein
VAPERYLAVFDTRVVAVDLGDDVVSQEHTEPSEVGGDGVRERDLELAGGSDGYAQGEPWLGFRARDSRRRRSPEELRVASSRVSEAAHVLDDRRMGRTSGPGDSRRTDRADTQRAPGYRGSSDRVRGAVAVARRQAC